MTYPNKKAGKPAAKTNTYAPSIGFWPTKSGKGFTVFIDENVKDMLANAEEGGRLFLQEVEAEQLEANDKSPHYRVVIFAAEGSEQKSERL